MCIIYIYICIDPYPNWLKCSFGLAWLSGLPVTGMARGVKGMESAGSITNCRCPLGLLKDWMNVLGPRFLKTFWNV